MSRPLKIVAICAAIFVVFLMVSFASLGYLLGPDGPGYDEGARMAIYAERFAEQFQKSQAQSATFFYTPKTGNDQTITVDLSPGQLCTNHQVGAPPCRGSGVTVRVQKGPSGNGYALGNGAAVPHELKVTKAHGPVQLDFKKVDGIVQVVGLE
jgi:hypothetical protein